MPSSHVFPGGVVESSDKDLRWLDLCSWKGDHHELSFRVAALRLIFYLIIIAIIFSSQRTV